VSGDERRAVVPRRPTSVTQADIARAIRAIRAIWAMRAAGYPDVRVGFKDGVVIVEPAMKDDSTHQGSVLPADQEDFDIL